MVVIKGMATASVTNITLKGLEAFFLFMFSCSIQAIYNNALLSARTGTYKLIGNKRLNNVYDMSNKLRN